MLQHQFRARRNILSRSVVDMVRNQHLRKFLLWCCILVGASIIFRSYLFYFPLSVIIPYWKRDVGRPLACMRPSLELTNPLISSFFKFTPEIECGGVDDSDWICIQNGSAQICDSVAKAFPNIRCNYTFFQRVDDYRTVVVKQFQNVSEVSMPTDFFHVRCTDATHRQWKSIMAGVHRDNHIVNASSFAKLPEKALKLNVFMFGFDSLSRLTFIRKLPRTYRYLTEVLGAVVLQGYNIVGDGTPQALIPILTGKTETELPETRKRMGDAAHHVNVYPFVWNEFKQNGYVTAFAEDTPGIGAFTYRLMGFGDQPTDHYMRTFYVEAENYFSEHRRLCLGNRPRHKVMMDYVEDYFNFYHDKPRFMFAFHGELSHDDYNLVGAADNDTLQMLKNLKERGNLENTLLIMMSDHGHRFAQIRETQQGKQEERLPFFSIALPPWFAKEHPTAYANLVINANRLTTPFDIHPTLLSILNFNESRTFPKTRSINLFLKIPADRTCDDANIETHWCTCLDWETIDIEDPMAKLASQALVNHINNITSSQRKLCAILQLKEISRVEKYVPHLDLLRFKKNADADGFVGDFSDNTSISQVVYQVKLVTMPGDGHFESSFEYDVKNNSFTVKTDLISRINAYGNDADCIMNTQQDLRKFCYCQNPVQLH